MTAPYYFQHGLSIDQLDTLVRESRQELVHRQIELIKAEAVLYRHQADYAALFLREKGILYNCDALAGFKNGPFKIRFLRTNTSRDGAYIIYRNYTASGKLSRAEESCSWTMCRYMEPFQPAQE